METKKIKLLNSLNGLNISDKDKNHFVNILFEENTETKEINNTKRYRLLKALKSMKLPFKKKQEFVDLLITDKFIEFYIGDNKYTAPPNMTW